MVVVVVVLALALIAAVVIEVACASGALGRNPVVGIRIPSLFASDEAWKVGHRAAIVPTAIGAALCLAALIAALLAPPATAALSITEVIVILASVIIAGVRARGAAHTAAEHIRDQRPRGSRVTRESRRRDRL